MSKGVKVCALVAGGLLALTIFGIANDGGRWGSRRGRGYEFGGRMFGLLESDRAKTELGLTDQQADKLRQSFLDSRKASIKTRADIQVRRMELHELLRDDKPDREVVMKKVQEISDLRAQMMRQHMESLLAAKTILTPEQQKKMRSFMASRGFGREGGRLRRPGFRRGPGGPGGPDGPAMPLAPEAPED